MSKCLQSGAGSKDRLNRAKTIDLCQNPLTVRILYATLSFEPSEAQFPLCTTLKQKEPKLARARQIPEWELYDAEIARFTRTLANDGRIHASAAAADVNELAKAGSIPVVVSDSVEETMPSGEEEVTTGPPIRDEL